jgi:DNA-directed RNA polymerase specialized sigma subunit
MSNPWDDLKSNSPIPEVISTRQQYRRATIQRRLIAKELDRMLMRATLTSDTQILEEIKRLNSLLEILAAKIAGYTEVIGFRRVKPKVEAPLDKLRETVIHLRVYKQMSKATLAQKLGVHKSQVCRWEKRSYKSISLDTLQQIIEILETYGQADNN